MIIKQGDIFWVDLGKPSGSEPAYRHPHLVIQNNVFNISRIKTVVMCSLTSNLQRAESPGNVLLDEGEANLSRQSVINITQIFTVDKGDLTEKIGSISRDRMAQVLKGIELLLKPMNIKD
jgi:mRNA interferase MazF